MPHNAVNEYKEQHPFQFAGAITSAQTALVVTGRDEDTVDALAAIKTVIIVVPLGTPAIEIRLRADGSDNDTSILDFYAKPKTGG